jgi:predicted glycosyltransferase involved in capsule biosynthesis
MKLTLGTTYYNNPDYLEKFIKRNLDYVDELIIVDDGSKLHIRDYVKPTNKIRLFRIKDDLGFNSHGCRNLIMKQSSNDFVILLDIDREFIFVKDAYKAIREAKLKDNVRYRFMAHSSMNETHGSVNDYLIHRKHFFSAGGYDEELIGERWGDREYFKQLLHFGKEKYLYGVDIMLTRRPSSSLKGLATSPKDKKISKENQELIDRRIKTPEPNKPILTFEWEEITS